MPSNTDNHEYQLFEDGEENWEHRTDFEKLDVDVELRGSTDPTTAGATPKDGAKFLNTSTGEIYLADGSSWTLEWDLGDIGSGGGGGDVSGVDGIDNRRQHVGPLHQGAYHSGSPDTQNTSGIVFVAQDLHIESCVVDAEAAGTETFELREYNSAANDPPVVDSTTVSLDAGPQRIPLGFDVPASGSGDSNDQYVLARAPTSSPVSLRRVGEADGGATLFEQYTYTDPPIDFLRGTATMTDGDFGAEAYYYYFFDLLVGASEDRVDAPWSTDVDEIYMRPRDPVEEYGDVSPRAIWLDTSQ